MPYDTHGNLTGIAAPHPAQLPKKDGETKPDEAARQELLNVLATEQHEDEEEEP